MIMGMTASQWLFIISGIAGVLIMSVIGARKVRVSSREMEPRQPPAGIGGREIQVFVDPDGIEKVMGRLREAGARQITIIPAGTVTGERSSPGRARLDIECDDEEQAGIYVDLLDAARKEEGLGIGPAYLSTVERVTGLAPA